MLVVTRYRVGAGDVEGFRSRARRALDVLSGRPGYLDGVIGRNIDDPGLWTLTTRWRDVGSYRRSLSDFEVRTAVVPLLSEALDEPTAYELDAGEVTGR